MDGEGNDQGPAHDVVDEIKAMGGEAIANGDDISDWDGAERLVQSAIDTFGGLDILINNAGILRDRMLTNMSEAEWDAVIKVHLKGTFAPSRHAAAYWRERSKAGETNDARIINTSSPSGIYGNVGQTNYGAAKAGIASFTIIAAKELGRYGVTVNAIAPAALTRMTEGLGMGQAPEEIKEQMSPAHIAPIVCWLASPESAHVTGRVFDVTGRMLSVSEGWHRGPSLENPPDDLAELGPKVSELVAQARPNANMQGYDEKSGASAPMPINPDAVGTKSEPARRSWTSKDALIYALGVGAGAADPLDELAFTTENTNDVPQRALPTMAVVLGTARRPAWASIGTFNPAMLVHGEQGITLHREIPVEGELEAVGEVTGIYDKGKGAVVVSESTATLVEHRRAAVLHPHVGLHPRRGRLGRRPRPVGHAEPGPRSRPRPHRHACRPAPTRRCSTASRATATRCTPTRRSRPWAASTGRSSTASAPTASPAGRCCTRCAAATRPGSRAWTPASRRRCMPGERLTVKAWVDGDGTADLPDLRRATAASSSTPGASPTPASRPYGGGRA